MAVLTSWNADNYYLQLELSSPLKIWKGEATSQRIAKTSCILQGGGCQIWISPADVRKILPDSPPIYNVSPNF